MKTYIVMGYIPFENWSVWSTHERKKEAEEEIRRIVEEGIFAIDDIRLVAELNFKVKIKKVEHSHKKGNWKGIS